MYPKVQTDVVRCQHCLSSARNRLRARTRNGLSLGLVLAIHRLVAHDPSALTRWKCFLRSLTLLVTTSIHLMLRWTLSDLSAPGVPPFLGSHPRSPRKSSRGQAQSCHEDLILGAKRKRRLLAGHLRLLLPDIQKLIRSACLPRSSPPLRVQCSRSQRYIPISPPGNPDKSLPPRMIL